MYVLPTANSKTASTGDNTELQNRNRWRIRILAMTKEPEQSFYFACVKN
jgi:hypothetical protein